MFLSFFYLSYVCLYYSLSFFNPAKFYSSLRASNFKEIFTSLSMTLISFSSFKLAKHSSPLNCWIPYFLSPYLSHCHYLTFLHMPSKLNSLRDKPSFIFLSQLPNIKTVKWKCRKPFVAGRIFISLQYPTSGVHTF